MSFLQTSITHTDTFLESCWDDNTANSSYYEDNLGIGLGHEDDFDSQNSLSIPIPSEKDFPVDTLTNWGLGSKGPTNYEWHVYEKWLKDVLRVSNREFQSIYAVQIENKIATVRLVIFLFFYRLQIPIQEIIPQNFDTAIGWKRKKRQSDNAIFLYVPLLSGDSSNFSTHLTFKWWFGATSHSDRIPITKFDMAHFGKAKICHVLHTKGIHPKLVDMYRPSTTTSFPGSNLLNSVSNVLRGHKPSKKKTKKSETKIFEAVKQCSSHDSHHTSYNYSHSHELQVNWMNREGTSPPSTNYLNQHPQKEMHTASTNLYFDDSEKKMEVTGEAQPMGFLAFIPEGDSMDYLSTDDEEENEEMSNERIFYHVKQRKHWDCGLACTEMILRALGVDKYGYKQLKAIIGTKSVWTIHLAYMFRYLNVNFTYCTTSLGVDTAHYSLNFYTKNKLFGEEVKAVNRLFKEAESSGVPVKHSSISRSQFSTLISNDNMILTLVDARRLRCSTCLKRPNKMSSFQGHYVLVTAYDSSSDMYAYLDPSRDHQCCFATADVLENARTADGTDEDTIVVWSGKC